MNDTIDTLKIKVEGEGQSAVKTLDDLIKTLEKIRGITASKNIGTLTSKLESLKSSINNIKTKNLSKLNAIFSTLSNANRINISPRLPERIRELGVAVDSLDGIDFTKLNEMASGLSALSRVGHVNLPRINNGGTSESEEDTTSLNETVEIPERAVTRAERFSTILSGIREKTEGVTSKMKPLGSKIKTALDTSAPSKFATALRAITRIAIYRFIRSMIKQITSAFKTGIDDMYQYSKTFNGSFAKSMDSAASSLLSFKNSIGAVMAPIIELVVPWLNKVVDKLFEINNTVAMVLAGLAGKKTYSKAVRVTTEYAAAADKAADKTSKVKDKVEELKKSLAGLDEITIIGNNLSPISSATGGNNSISDGVDYSSMFVEAPVDMAKVEEFKKKLDQILTVAKLIGLAILTWEFAKFLSSIATVIKNLDVVQKKILGLTLIIVGFGLEYSGSFHIGYGDAQLWDYIKTALGAALGIAGSLLVFGTGPLGWTIGITAAIAVAITGISVGMNKKLADVVEEAFYDAGGTITISDLADQFERYMRAIQSSHQPTINLGTEVQDLVDNSISPAINEIRSIGKAIEYDESTASEKLPMIRKKFEELYNNSTDILHKTHDLIVQSVAGGFGDTLKSLGVDVPQLMALVNGTTADVEKKMTDLEGKFEKLHSQREAGKITTEAYNAAMSELLTEFAKINGVVDPVTESFEGVKESLEGIDWQNKDSRDLAFSKISESAIAAKEAVEESYKQLKTSLEYYARNAETEEARLKYEEMIAGSKTYRDEQIKMIQEKTQTLLDFCQSDMIQKMSNTNKELRDYYAEHGWGIKTMFMDEESYVYKGLESYRDNVIKPAEEEMSSLLSKLGMKIKPYASNAASRILSGFYDYGSSNADGIDKKIENYFSTKAGIIPESIKNTIDANKDKVKNSAESLHNNITSPFLNPGKELQSMNDSGSKLIGSYFKGMENEAETHSPSKRSARLTHNILSGMIPTSSDTRSVVTAFESFLNTLFDRLETFTNRWRSAINTMFDDMAYGWKNANFRTDGSYSYKYLTARNIQRFAQGGFPEDGLFYANHNELVGQFSNGKTAVANNEQIVEGIAEGVTAANEDQNALLREQNRLLRQLLDKDLTVGVSTIASAFNRKNQRDGKVSVPVSI